jgi:hypothetical protein
VDQAIWITDDGGGTWAEAADPGFGELAVGPIAMSGDGLRIRGVAQRLQSTEYVVIGSDDGGASWLAPHALEGWADPILALYRDDGEALYITAFGPGGTPFFLGLDADFTSNAQTLALLDSPARSAVRFDGVLYLVTDGAGLHVLAPGEDLMLLPAGGPSACLVAAGDHLLGCGHDPGLPQFLASDDGAQWESLIGFADVQPRDCPADSIAAEVCPSVWEALQETIDLGDDDDSSEDDDGDDADGRAPDGDRCEGCAVTPGRSGGGGAALLVLGLLRLGARRGRSGRPSAHSPRS